jgi:hypothetical protein
MSGNRTGHIKATKIGTGTGSWRVLRAQRREALAALLDMDHVAQLQALQKSVSYDAEDGQAPNDDNGRMWLPAELALCCPCIPRPLSSIQQPLLNCKHGRGRVEAVSGVDTCTGMQKEHNLPRGMHGSTAHMNGKKPVLPGQLAEADPIVSASNREQGGCLQGVQGGRRMVNISSLLQQDSPNAPFRCVRLLHYSILPESAVAGFALSTTY